MHLGLAKPLKRLVSISGGQTTGLKAGVSEKIPQLHPSF
jgi:hypothetical protein